MEHAVIRLKAGEKTPFYEQIYAYFAAAIRSGALAAGEKLPSKRRLAQDVGVSISTVETAYAMLVAEGYLEPKRVSCMQPFGAAAPGYPRTIPGRAGANTAALRFFHRACGHHPVPLCRLAQAAKAGAGGG